MPTRAGVRWLPWFLFAAAVCPAIFLAGVYVESSRTFPYGWVRAAYKTVLVNLRAWEEPEDVHDVHSDDPDDASRDLGCVPPSDEMWQAFRGHSDAYAGLNKVRCLSADVSNDDVAAARVEFVAGERLEEPILVKGEFGAFLDHCPGPAGCLAVEYSRTGAVVRAWPFRPEEIGAANIVPASAYPHEHRLGWSFLHGVDHFTVARLGDDLLVILEFADTFPYAGGVARVAPDGAPRWFRKDYSHHWLHMVDEDRILVPSMRVSRSFLSYDVGKGEREREGEGEGEERHRRGTVDLECEDGKILEDQINVVNGRGEVLERLPVLDAIARSRHAHRLVGANGCDPTHLNFVHMLGEDSAGVAGLAPGDLVISLHNLSAFGILDGSSGRLKRLVRGSFHFQHGVQHLARARFVMFDNLGTDGVHGPSRLLLVDLATGEETTLYPTATTPASLRLGLTEIRGQLDISSDGRRALVADPTNARALEIRLADGEVLNVFHSMHDMSSLEDMPESLVQNAFLFQVDSVHYVNRRQAFGRGAQRAARETPRGGMGSAD